MEETINKRDQRIIEKEGVHVVTDGNGEAIAILRRDPVSKKHLIYLLTEASSDEIATKVIK